ncbi:MAG: O-antigen ligase family protein, partial [Lentisphaeria bacterium]|nr:O-antigen ligase family protein [Lentisphaeria bacterium]
MQKTQEFTRLQKIVNFLMLTAVLLAPLKMGNMILPGLPLGLPGGVWDVVLTNLPVPWLAVFSGVMLLMSLIAYGVNDRLSLSSWSGRLLWLWLWLPLVALLGFVNADSLENPVIELEYVFMLCSFASAAALTLNGAGALFRRKMLNCMAIGTILTALWGAHQYFFGFEEMRNFIAEQEKAGVMIAPELKARALDVRTFATFTFASALAGMFCLSGAVTVIRAGESGKRFEPSVISQWVFVILTAVLCSTIFLTTKGRSAFLSVTAAAALCGLVSVKSRKIKAAALAAALVVVIAGACYIHFAGRGFGSMTERVGYLKSSAEMLAEHPFCGGGWGNFTFHHAINKNFGNEELAKDPHNFVAAFASQTGIFGGLLTVALLIAALLAAYKNLRREVTAEKLAIFFGLSAFSLHMLMDLDWQVIGLMLWYAVLMFAGAYKDDSDGVLRKQEKYPLLAICSLLAVCTVAGGIHWSIADIRHYELQETAGQLP